LPIHNLPARSKVLSVRAICSFSDDAGIACSLLFFRP